MVRLSSQIRYKRIINGVQKKEFVNFYRSSYNVLFLEKLQQTEEEISMEEEISLRELIEILLRGKWVIAVITITAVLAAGILSFFVIPPTYEAQTALMVSAVNTQVEENEGSAFRTLMDSISRYPQMTVETYRAQVKNPTILREVIDTLNLDPEKYTVESLKESINVEAVKDTNLIYIKVKDGDPELAADIANTVSDKFVSFISEAVREQMGKSAEFIKTRLDSEKENLEEATEELKAFLAQPRSVDELKKEIDSKLAQLTAFKTELVDLEIQEKELTASLDRAVKELRKQPETLKTLKSITDDQLLARIAEEAANGSLKELYGLKMESEEINPVFISLTNKIADYQIRLSGIRAKKDSISREIENTRIEIEKLQVELAQKQVEYDRIRRKVNLAEYTYDTFQQKYQEARITLSAQLGETSIMVVSPAYIPEKPVSPRKMLNIAISAVLGIMIGAFTVFFIEYWKNTGPSAEAAKQNIKV